MSFFFLGYLRCVLFLREDAGARTYAGRFLVLPRPVSSLGEATLSLRSERASQTASHVVRVDATVASYVRVRQYVLYQSAVVKHSTSSRARCAPDSFRSASSLSLRLTRTGALERTQLAYAAKVKLAAAVRRSHVLTCRTRIS